MLRSLITKIPDRKQFTNSLANASTAAKLKERNIPVKGMSMNPYVIFVKEQFDTNSPLVQNKINMEAIKSVSNAWKSMDAKKKDEYKKKSIAYREQKIAEFNQLSEDLQKQKIEESIAQKMEKAKRRERKARREEWESTGHPQIPPNSYVLFTKEYMDKAKGAGKLTNVKDVVREAAQTWKSMSESDKKKYVDEANKLREVYKVELSKWKEQHQNSNQENMVKTPNEKSKQKSRTPSPMSKKN